MECRVSILSPQATTNCLKNPSTQVLHHREDAHITFLLSPSNSSAPANVLSHLPPSSSLTLSLLHTITKRFFF